MDGADSDHNSYHHALPERYENDKFDTQELPYRFEWSEFFLQCCVEGEEGCEGECDRDVDDNCDVEPARMRTEGRFIVETQPI